MPGNSSLPPGSFRFSYVRRTGVRRLNIYQKVGPHRFYLVPGNPSQPQPTIHSPIIPNAFTAEYCKVVYQLSLLADLFEFVTKTGSSSFVPGQSQPATNIGVFRRRCRPCPSRVKSPVLPRILSTLQTAYSVAFFCSCSRKTGRQIQKKSRKNEKENK